MPKATAPARNQHAGEVANSRPCDRDVRLERVRIDDGGDGVGGVVEAVDELEAERDQQRADQHEVRTDRSSLLDGEIGNQMGRDVEQARGEDQPKDDNSAGARLSCEFFVDRATLRKRTFDSSCHGGLPCSVFAVCCGPQIYAAQLTGTSAVCCRNMIGRISALRCGRQCTSALMAARHPHSAATPR